MDEKKPLTIEDLDELKVWKKRDAFMALFFKVHEDSEKDSTLISLKDSYHVAELIWANEFKGKAYASDESFLRTYYYYMNEKIPKQETPVLQYSLF